MKLYAIPKRADGTDSLGTFGVMSGEYQSVRNFIRFNVSKNAKAWTTYSLWRKTSSSGWKKLGEYDA